MKTDAQLQEDVTESLRFDPRVSQAHIGVTATDGVVSLTGNVPNYVEKCCAEKAAQRVLGVKAVVEKIEVKIPDPFVRGDQEIAKAILNHFTWNAQIPDELLKVKVEGGWAELSGEVEWAFQKHEAEKCVRALTGVKGVIDNISVMSPVESVNIKQKIEMVLKRNADIESQRIRVDVSGNKVTLSGEVRSFGEMGDIKWAAWGVPGVTSVINKMNVNILQ
jgi:osmotically-inducible protein OsmY